LNELFQGAPYLRAQVAVSRLEPIVVVGEECLQLVEQQLLQVGLLRPPSLVAPAYFRRQRALPVSIEQLPLDQELELDLGGWIRIAWRYEYENDTAKNWDETIWVYDSDSPWPRFNGIELRRYFEDATEYERQSGATGVLLIDYLHPLRIFYDISDFRLLRMDFIPITYREVQWPTGWGW